MTDFELLQALSENLKINFKSINATVTLLNEGATVPFIARYRKEQTGNMDEVQVLQIKNELERLKALEQRRSFILQTIIDQGKLTSELEQKISNATTISQLEDLYLPYKPKRKTKASIAREKGLEPLALLILEQSITDLELEANKYIDTEKQVTSINEALQGARDIVAEIISEDATVRTAVRSLFQKTAIIKSLVIKGKETEGEKFEDYFEWEEPLSKCPSHRMLAMRRGEKEDVLLLDIFIDNSVAIDAIKKQFITTKNACALELQLAIEDGYKRLLNPSLEAEMRVQTKQQADEKAIQVFADNLKELLLASPLGQKAILALDPGFRTGCKVVALNPQGKLLEETVIYPHDPQRRVTESQHVVMALCAKHNIEAIAIGNGTASRETEQFIRQIEVLPKSISILMVSESGASIYSASDVAREEFPEYDLTVRGAISIGRRLADPLAELVKLDPKSIGVGQYQHDVDQYLLKDKLDSVVMSCVNAVGVEVNTASKQLLSYVSGIGDSLAKNIVEYRNENGPFKSREDFKKVNRMGDKVFEQCSGFLRIQDGRHPLDKSAVHPESYKIVEQMAEDLECTINQLISKEELRKKINLNKYVTDTIGLPTLKDILQELEKPGRDPRQTFEHFAFDDKVHSIKDLTVGMRLAGIVTNVTNFGAFVDIGVHQDGLVHVSQLSNTFVTDPNTIVKVGQKVNVVVTDCDVQRKRIALSMKDENNYSIKSAPKRPDPEVSFAENDIASALAALKDKFKKLRFN